MNSKLKKKILLDVVMTILLIVLMGYFASGALWHEIIGVAVLLMVIFHNLINIKWYIGILFHKSKNLNYKIYLSLITNLLLVINTLILLVSSIIISRKLFTMFNLKPTELWYYLHRASGYLELIIVSIHLGLHWKMIMVSFRKLFKLKENNKIRNIILRIIAFLLAVFGVKASFDRNIGTKLLPDPKEDSYDIYGSLQNLSVSTLATKRMKETIALNSITKYVSASDNILLANNDESQMTLREYLGSLHCNGCGRHCSLLSPRCGKGSAKVEEAKEEYQEKYAKSTEDETTTEQDTSQENETTSQEATEKETNAESNIELETTRDDAIAEKNEIEDNKSSNEDREIVIELEDEDDLVSIFSDFTPIMGLYAAGTYYSLKIIDKIVDDKKKK